jgi:hypothetical protein
MQGYMKSYMVEFNDIEADEWCCKIAEIAEIARNNMSPKPPRIYRMSKYIYKQTANQLLDLLDKLKITKR